MNTSGESHGPFDLALKEGFFDSLFFDKLTAVATLRALETMQGPLAEHFLKRRPPDRDYAPELVATIAATLIRDHTADDYELAVARALCLLDITHQTLDQYQGKGSSEASSVVPYGEAMKRITGAHSVRKAEERYIGEIVRWGYEYADDKEVKIYQPTADEIEAALAPFRLAGFAPTLVDRLRQQHLARVGRSHAENLKKKATEIKIVA